MPYAPCPMPHAQEYLIYLRKAIAITNYQLPLKCIELYTFGISRHFAFLLP